MKTLNTILGNAERFLVEYLFYINAKNIVFAYNHHYKQYLGFDLSEEVLNNAKSVISLWKGKIIQ